MPSFNLRFNLQFLYELKHKVRLSETVCDNLIELKAVLNNRFISYLNLFISLIKEHPLKEHMCNFKIGKITYSNRSLEQRMTIAKISRCCIPSFNVFLSNSSVKPFEGYTQKPFSTLITS